jgi:glycosyltransferase involved in cell wall biosynthesis
MMPKCILPVSRECDILYVNSVNVSGVSNYGTVYDDDTASVKWLCCPPQGNAGITVKKELKIPLFFHVHSTEVGRSVGRGSHSIKDIEFEGGQAADCVITVSNAMADELLKLGFPHDKIRPCWNGVDPAKYDPAKVSNDDRLALRRRYGVRGPVGAGPRRSG